MFVTISLNTDTRSRPSPDMRESEQQACSVDCADSTLQGLPHLRQLAVIVFPLTARSTQLTKLLDRFTQDYDFVSSIMEPRELVLLVPIYHVTGTGSCSPSGCTFVGSGLANSPLQRSSGIPTHSMLWRRSWMGSTRPSRLPGKLPSVKR